MAKHAFAKLLNASGGVDVARMRFDAAHAKHENMHESAGDEDAKELEGQVQKARDGAPRHTLMENEKPKLLELIFLLVRRRAMGIVEQNVESKEKAAGVKKDVASEDVLSSPTHKFKWFPLRARKR